MSTGAIVEAGGNKVFFANGALTALNDAGISFDVMIGRSSALPIILATRLNLNTQILEEFAAKLDANAKNFYLFRCDHFPHDGIYRSSVESLVTKYYEARPRGADIFIAAATSSRQSAIKALATSAVLGLKHGIGLDLTTQLCFWAGITEERISHPRALPQHELVNFILGSSSIYPFIKRYTIGDQLVLEGALFPAATSDFPNIVDKRVIIHTERGKSGVTEGIFHLFPSEELPNNVLDYTSGAAIRALHMAGMNEMRHNMAPLEAFLKS